MRCPSCQTTCCTRCLYRNDGSELPWTWICFACFIDVPGRRNMEPPGCEHFPMKSELSTVK